MVKHKQTKTSTTKMSSNGQVVIPGQIRKEIALTPGMQFHVLSQDGNVIMTPIRENISTAAVTDTANDDTGLEPQGDDSSLE